MAVETRFAEEYRAPVQTRVEVCMDLQEQVRKLIELSVMRDSLVLQKQYDDARICHGAIKTRLAAHFTSLVEATPLLTSEWPRFAARRTHA